jgi:N-acetylglucosamine kinase-like BadF-type ATPase
MHVAWYLGIDAGGTRTKAALAWDRREIARAEGGSVKLLRVSEQQARESLRSLLEEVSAKAKAPLNEVRATCVGLSGLSVAEVRESVEQLLREMVAGEQLLCGDEEIALEAAFPEPIPGVLVISGTGSHAVVRTPTGEIQRVGGWGPALGDEGSGYWIGREAVRHALRAHDAGERTAVLQAVAQAWGCSTLNEIVSKAHSASAPDFAALVPVVVRAAEFSDAVAVDVLQSAGEELARLALLAGRHLNGGTLRIGWTGSVLRRVAPVRHAMAEALIKAQPTAEMAPEAADPLIGALDKARASMN